MPENMTVEGFLTLSHYYSYVILFNILLFYFLFYLFCKIKNIVYVFIIYLFISS